MARTIGKFASDLVTAIRGNAINTIAAGVIAGSLAAGTYFFGPIREYVSNWREAKNEAESNIDEATALRYARRAVGADARWAMPFRNRGDPSQYIAVWAASSSDSDPCLRDVKPAECRWGTGAARAVLLVGADDVFEVVPTYTYLAPDWLSLEAQAEMSWYGMPVERHFLPFYGVTDWNGDGVKEVLSIAEQEAMTSPRSVTLVSLFDTRSLAVTQLRVDRSNTISSQRYSGATPSPALRKWLFGRYNEAWDNFGNDKCARARDGVLTCPQMPNDPEEEKELEARFNLESAAIDRWVESNGSNFVLGQIRLNYVAGTILSASNGVMCYLRDGDLALANMFKGPLLLVDTRRARTSALYVQDGDHSREIPNVIVGKRYYWLSMAIRGRPIVIDKRTMQSIRIGVGSLEGTVPDTDRQISDQAGTKDQQINMSLEGRRITYGVANQPVYVEGTAVD